jgi:hypothetical protein
LRNIDYPDILIVIIRLSRHYVLPE